MIFYISRSYVIPTKSTLQPTLRSTVHTSTTLLNDTVFVILLESDAVRVKHVNEMMAEHPALNPRIWPAVTTKQLGEPRFQPYYSANSASKVRQGAIACALSHITLLEWFVNSGLPSMIVLEDDAELDPEFESKYATFRRNLPPDFELCQLLHHDTMKSLRGKSKYKIAGNRHVMKAYGAYGTAAYLVSRQGAVKLLARVKPMFTTIDDMYIRELRASNIKGYMPTNDLTVRTYPYKSNVWKTKTGPIVVAPLPTICKSFPYKWDNNGARNKMLVLLNDTHHLLESIGVEYSIHASTVLGHMRHRGNFIPWDDDIDLYIRPKATSKVVAAIKAHPVYCTEPFWGGPKIYRCDSPPIKPYAWAYPFIDIFNTAPSPKNSYGGTNFFPSRLGTFAGLTVRLPNNVDAILNKLYGANWATECVSSKFDHARERTTKYGGKKVDCAELQEQCGTTWPKEMAYISS